MHSTARSKVIAPQIFIQAADKSVIRGEKDIAQFLGILADNLRRKVLVEDIKDIVLTATPEVSGSRFRMRMVIEGTDISKKPGAT